MGYSWVPLRVTVCLIRLSSCDCKQTSEYSEMEEILVSCLGAVYITAPPASGSRHDAWTPQSHRPSWCKCFAEMKYRTSIYYLLAAAHEDILSPVTITVYTRHHNSSPQMDASVRVRVHARQGWLADENEWGYKRDSLWLALTERGHLHTIISPLIQDSSCKDVSTWYCCKHFFTWTTAQ